MGDIRKFDGLVVKDGRESADGLPRMRMACPDVDGSDNEAYKTMKGGENGVQRIPATTADGERVDLRRGNWYRRREDVRFLMFCLHALQFPL